MTTTSIMPVSLGKKRQEELEEFARFLRAVQNEIGFKVSSRGWGYVLEGRNVGVTKADFDRVEELVNECREKGILPIDFTAEEEARKFSGIEIPDSQPPVTYFKRLLGSVLNIENIYTPDWWDGEEYYIQMVVEKVDLKTLFAPDDDDIDRAGRAGLTLEPVCQNFHIPIATSKGWSSMLQRAEYARRFKEAEARGLKCVLLYCGDHDPDGLRIADNLRKNLEDIRDIVWEDGETGYDPSDLIIDRFGLKKEFIDKNRFPWIENLITGSGKNLASPSHPNHYLPYVQQYIREIGERKCEANVLVTNPQGAQQLCRDAIESYLGAGALRRFKVKRDIVKGKVEKFLEKARARKAIDRILETEDPDQDGD